MGSDILDWCFEHIIPWLILVWLGIAIGGTGYLLVALSIEWWARLHGA